MEETSKISLRLFQRKLPWRGPSKVTFFEKNLGCICCMTIWPDFSRVLKWVNVEIITRQRLFTMGPKSSWIRIWNFVFLHIIFSLQLPKQFKDVSSANFRNVIRYWKTNLWYVFKRFLAPLWVFLVSLRKWISFTTWWSSLALQWWSRVPSHSRLKIKF